MNIQNKKPFFSTDNFALAIFLKTESCRLLHITRETPKHAFFNFEESSLRKQLTDDFWNKKALIEPMAFYNTQKELKTILYDKSYPTKND